VSSGGWYYSDVVAAVPPEAVAKEPQVTLFGLDGDDATQASTWSPVGLQPGAKDYYIRRQVMIRNELSERLVVLSAGGTNSQGRT